MRLTWRQPPPQFIGNQGASITNYNVQLTPADGSRVLTFKDVPAAAGSYVITGLDPDTTYTVDTDYYVQRPTDAMSMLFNVDLPSQVVTTCKYFF